MSVLDGDDDDNDDAKTSEMTMLKHWKTKELKINIKSAEIGKEKP